MTEREALIEAEATREVLDISCACVGPSPGERLCGCGLYSIDSLLAALHKAGYAIVSMDGSTVGQSSPPK